MASRAEEVTRSRGMIKRVAAPLLILLIVYVAYISEPTLLAAFISLLAFLAAIYLVTLLPWERPLDIDNGLKIVVSLGLVCFLSCLFSHLDDALGIVAIFGIVWLSLLVAVPFTLVLGYNRWKKVSKWWMVPCVVSFLFLWTPEITSVMGEAINDWRFESNLEKFNYVVDQVKNGLIKVGPEIGMVNLGEARNLPEGVIAMRGARAANGSVVVEFLTSAGGRIHKGYVFRELDNTASDHSKEEFLQREAHFHLRHVVGNWYRFSD